MIGHDGKQTKAIYMAVKDYDDEMAPYVGGGTVRNQYNVYTSNNNLEEAYARYWIKLQPNLEDVMPSSWSWRNIMEWRESGEDYRWCIYIARDGGERLHWRTKAQWGVAGNSAEHWTEISDNPSPESIAGEWALLEVYWKHSTGNDGRVWAAINGKTICDHHGPNKKDSDIRLWNAFKVYTGEDSMDTGLIYHWIDDFELYDGIPCQSGETDIGQDGCSAGETCCCWELFQGISLPFSQIKTLGGYSDSDYVWIKDHGYNYVEFWIHWTQTRYDRGLEQNELEPYTYREPNLLLLEQEVAKAQSHGLKTGIGLRVYYHGSGGYGWTDNDSKGFNYVNLNEKDSAGVGGRERYVRMINYIAGRFKTCIIDPWVFPGHGQANVITEESERIFYEVTQPAFIDAIRSAGNNQPIILNPLLQGCYFYGWPADWSKLKQTGAFESPNFKTHSDPNIYYGTNGHDNYNSLCTGSGNWDYDVDRLREMWQPAVDFATNHKVICVEFGSLDIHNSRPERPIDSSRIAWLRESLKICEESGISIAYHRYEYPVSVQSPRESDGLDSEVQGVLDEFANL